MNDTTDPTALSPSDKLAILARTLPGAARGITALVDREYGQIKKARDNGWPWADVAAALDLPEKAGAIASAYARVQKNRPAPSKRKPKAPPARPEALPVPAEDNNDPPAEREEGEEGAASETAFDGFI